VKQNEKREVERIIHSRNERKNLLQREDYAEFTKPISAMISSDSFSLLNEVSIFVLKPAASGTRRPKYQSKLRSVC